MEAADKKRSVIGMDKVTACVRCSDVFNFSLCASLSTRATGFWALLKPRITQCQCKQEIHECLFRPSTPVQSVFRTRVQSVLSLGIWFTRSTSAASRATGTSSRSSRSTRRCSTTSRARRGTRTPSCRTPTSRSPNSARKGEQESGAPRRFDRCYQVLRVFLCR